ncbi:hypothetical protein F5Y16DRAFT_397730 [Xylariaceae sp. FL0255]|nr:hypothetical protein F5Y16DRAFT_397730 [Xylariaceae sp. FL0255]
MPTESHKDSSQLSIHVHQRGEVWGSVLLKRIIVLLAFVFPGIIMLFLKPWYLWLGRGRLALCLYSYASNKKPRNLQKPVIATSDILHNTSTIVCARKGAYTRHMSVLRKRINNFLLSE